MKTAVVILNWNTEGFLKKFLPGLIRSSKKVEGTGIIVADNASADGSVEMVKACFPEVRTLSFDCNHGFTGGYNHAFDAICDSDDAPEYFVLINSDIEVTEDWLLPLTEWMDLHPECGACAPKLHSWTERDKFEYAGAAGGFIDKFGYPFCRGRVMNRVEKDDGQYDDPADVLWATGACLMVRSSVYKELGGLDWRFFAHMEEIDLCWRMQLRGYKVTVVPQSVVYHVGGGTLPSASPFKLHLNYRNNLLMLSNNLAKTFALKFYKEGKDIGTSAGRGRRLASARIAARKCLDGISAIVYLLTFRPSYFKAVIKAYSEVKDYSPTYPDTASLKEYLKEYGERASVKGIYRKWIILESVLRGRNIFRSIREKNFYKI